VFDWRIRPTAAQLVKAFDQYYTTGECNVVGAVKALPTPIEEDANSRAFMDAEDYIDMGDYTFGFIGFAAIAAIVAIIAAVVVIVLVILFLVGHMHAYCIKRRIVCSSVMRKSTNS
jgi:hypothetical protein